MRRAWMVAPVLLIGCVTPYQPQPLAYDPNFQTAPRGEMPVASSVTDAQLKLVGTLWEEIAALKSEPGIKAYLEKEPEERARIDAYEDVALRGLEEWRARVLRSDPRADAYSETTITALTEELRLCRALRARVAATP